MALLLFLYLCSVEENTEVKVDKDQRGVVAQQFEVS